MCGQPAIDDATGERRALLELWEAQPTDPIELAVTLGERQRLASRLLAVRVPQDVAATRRRRLWQAARATGRQVSATRLALAAWPLCVPNVPPERLTLREALVLGRMRWQIEGFWRVLKEKTGAGRSFANLHLLYQRTRQVLMGHQERPIYEFHW